MGRVRASRSRVDTAPSGSPRPKRKEGPALAPLSIPIHRRKETATVALVAVMVFISVVLIILLVINPITLVLVCIPYAVWLVVYDWDRARDGTGRPLPWLKRLSVWDNFRNYFPATSVVDDGAKFDANGRYLLGVHPHGIVSCSTWATFALQYCPHLPFDYRIGTVSFNFRLPIWRDWLLGCSFVDVGFASASNVLKSGKSLFIIVGGAQEALDARPGCYDLTLNRRKGFIRLALVNGADLVPVFCFGENDLYDSVVDNSIGTRTRRIQTAIQKAFGYSVPLINGRGVFNYRFGLLPHRRPTTTVIGPPIKVKQNAEPTQAEIDALHAQYVEALTTLHDKHRATYGHADDAPLRLIS